jgi:hypothetical protein
MVGMIFSASEDTNNSHPAEVGEGILSKSKQTTRSTYLWVDGAVDGRPDWAVDRRVFYQWEGRVTMKKIGFLLCLLFSCSLFADVDVTGNWEMTISSPRGERTRVVEFVQDGEALTVITEGRDGERIEAEGTVKGTGIEWMIRRETPRGIFEMKYKGKIEGDAMKGTVQFGQGRTSEWTAKRVD